MQRIDVGALLLAIAIASVGCGGEEDGGAGGTGPATALSFDADTALPASAGAATAIAFAVQFGAVMGNVFAGLSGGSAQSGPVPKVNIPVPGFCSAGTAVLDWDDASSNNQLEVGEIVLLTLESCSGSPVASAPASGTIRLTIEEVGGGLPIIGGIIGARAEVNLEIAGSPPTTITGTFRVDANIPLTLALVNLTFIAVEQNDAVRVTEGEQSLGLECFNIFQRAGLAGPGVQFFRPFGVARLGNQVYSLNDPSATPDIGFDFSSGSPVPTSGSVALFSGNRGGEACSGGAPQGDNSSCTITFNPDACVDVECMGNDGAPFARSIFWSNLLDFDFSSASEELCSGGNGGTTPAVEFQGTCDDPDNLMAIADAFVRGGTSAEEDYQNTSYGTRPNLTIKSVADLRFSRKIYIVFDLSTAPSTFNKASLVLTLIRHIESARDPVNSSGPQPVDVYGIVDDNLITDENDWDPATLAEDAITWNNAPRNETTAGNAFEDSAGVQKFIPGYDFDLESDEVMDEPGTRYALDITEYVRGRLTNDADKKITVLMTIPTLINVEGSEFKSRDIPDAEMCDRPFLHFE